MAKIKKQPEIDRDICAGCSLCIENCPGDCLELSEPRFRGDIRITAVRKKDAECIGCGICEKVCPVGAVRMRMPGAAEEAAG